MQRPREQALRVVCCPTSFSARVAFRLFNRSRFPVASIRVPILPARIPHVAGSANTDRDSVTQLHYHKYETLTIV